MKRFIAILVAILAFSWVANAQLMTANTYTRKARPHNIWLDVAAGSFTKSVIGTDVKTKSISFDAALRWTVPFGDFFAWDIIDLGINPIFDKDFEDDPVPCFYLMTGPRVQVELVEKFFVYAAADGGVAHHLFYNRNDKTGFISEFSAGVMFNRRIHFGAFLRSYPAYKIEESGFKYSTIGAKVGFSF
jgi:hypothetical protein